MINGYSIDQNTGLRIFTNEVNDFSNAPELPFLTETFLINGTHYETNSLAESITDLSTGEVFQTLQPLLQHLAPDLYSSYTFNPDFPDNFYYLGDATRVRVIRRLQYLHNKPPVTPLVRELAPLIYWIAQNTSNSQTVSRSYWRAMYATDGNQLEATALILYYGIWSSHNAHGKAVPNFNYHTIKETADSIIIKTVVSSMKPRFENVRQVGLQELDRYNRIKKHKNEDTIKKLAFRAFYSGEKNGGIWISQTPDIHQYLQKLIVEIVKFPKKDLPNYEPPNFEDLFTCVVPKKPLDKRNYYRPSGYQDIPLEPGRIYKTQELIDMGIISSNLAKAKKKGYLLNPDRGIYMLNPDWIH